MIQNLEIITFELSLIYRMADTTSATPEDTSVHMEKGWFALKQHIIDNKIKVGLWVTRLFTLIFTIGYIIPIFGYVVTSYFII